MHRQVVRYRQAGSQGCSETVDAGSARQPQHQREQRLAQRDAPPRLVLHLESQGSVGWVGRLARDGVNRGLGIVAEVGVDPQADQDRLDYLSGLEKVWSVMVITQTHQSRVTGVGNGREVGAAVWNSQVQ